MGKRVAHLVTGAVLEYVALDEDFVLVEMTAPTRADRRAARRVGAA